MVKEPAGMVFIVATARPKLNFLTILMPVNTLEFKLKTRLNNESQDSLF